jgi:peptidoglycan/LPS O-acetylase OafA/YrhL
VVYRSDIDGMRCLAVSSVFLFHLNNRLLPGGFTGVDIFFVISGFLITRIIATEMREGSFSMAGFYARRVRRIFPALFAVLFVTAVMAVVALGPEPYQRFFQEFRYSCLQISNFIFARERGYFEPASEMSLLLHTWSLGVEEQFYLVWPLLILVMFRLRRNSIVPILAGITLFSIIYSDYLCNHSPSTAFYMLPSRAWELGTGGLVAVASLPRLRSTGLLNLLAITGLALVFVPMLMLDGTMPFPGRNALPSVLGIALLLYTGGQQEKSIVFRLLSWKPFVAIGLISYSLYLWHWPLIVFHKITTGSQITLLSGSVIFALATACSTLSYFLIERPCRYGSLPGPLHRIYSGFTADDNRLQKAGLHILLLLILPAAATSLMLYSLKTDNTRSSTSLSLDLELIAHRAPLSKEFIAIFWKDDGGFYSKENSQVHLFDEEHKTGDKTYHFEFTLPGLARLRDIRLDPLHEEGEVRIANVEITGGLFRIPRPIDTAALGDESGGARHNLIAVSSEAGLTLKSTDYDPYFILLQGKQRNSLETLIVFAILLSISIVLLANMHLVKRGNGPLSALTAGSMVMIFTLLMSSRLLYSDQSQWRFLQTKDAHKRFTTIPIDKIASIPQSDDPDIAMFGDSHVGNFAATVHHWSTNNGMSLKILAQPACPPLFYDIPKHNGRSVLNHQFNGCMKRYHRFIDEIIANPKTGIVFIAFREEFFLENPFILFNSDGKNLLSGTETYADLIERSFTRTVEMLLDGGKRVVLLGQVPLLHESPESCLMRDVTLYSAPFKKESNCDIDATYSDMMLQSGRDLFSRFPKLSPNVWYFDPGKYITSIFGDHNDVLYFDDNHLNKIGVTKLTPFLEEELSEFLHSDQSATNTVAADGPTS